MKYLAIIFILNSAVTYSQNSREIYALYGDGIEDFKFKGIDFSSFKEFSDDEEMLNYLYSEFGKPIDTTMLIMGNFKYGYNFEFKNYKMKYYKKLGFPQLFEMTIEFGGPSFIMKGNNLKENMDFVKTLNRTGINHAKVEKIGPDENGRFATEKFPYYIEVQKDKNRVENIKIYLKHD